VELYLQDFYKIIQYICYLNNINDLDYGAFIVDLQQLIQFESDSNQERVTSPLSTTDTTDHTESYVSTTDDPTATETPG
jgi:hypothetical protein